jgi:uncharacterized protein YjiS (DUF1127 family)
MNMLSTQYEAAAVRGRLVHRIVQIVWGCVTAFNRWYERRMTLRYLQSVDDRILDDIGIRRTEILAAIYGGRNRADA